MHPCQLNCLSDQSELVRPLTAHSAAAMQTGAEAEQAELHSKLTEPLDAEEQAQLHVLALELACLTCSNSVVTHVALMDAH